MALQYLGTMFDRICANEIIMDSIDSEDKSSIIAYSNPDKHGFLEKRGAFQHAGASANGVQKSKALCHGISPTS